MTARELATSWRSDAAVLRRWGAVALAEAAESRAAELEQALAAGEGEEVTIAEASRLSGYSAAHLRRMISEGLLRNVSDNGRPRVRRGDLPKKPGHRAA